jgi:hypothetical protein
MIIDALLITDLHLKIATHHCHLACQHTCDSECCYKQQCYYINGIKSYTAMTNSKSLKNINISCPVTHCSSLTLAGPYPWPEPSLLWQNPIICNPIFIYGYLILGIAIQTILHLEIATNIPRNIKWSHHMILIINLPRNHLITPSDLIWSL